MISAFSCGATQHCPLAPGSRWQIRNQGAQFQSAFPFSCPLPKPPCRPWPRSLALQTHTSQDRPGQARPLLSLPIAVMPLRRVFSARPALPRPYGHVRPPEPSSTAQLQATLKDKCTAECFLILKSCASHGSLATHRSLSKHLCGNFQGARCRSTFAPSAFSGMRWEKPAAQQCSCASPVPAIRTDCTHSAAIFFLSNQPSKHALLKHMDRDRLQDVLTEARVPESLQDLVLARGFDCPSDFAFAFPTIAELQPFIVSARDFWNSQQH